jgi:two-component system, NarL family, sensor kinase
MSNNQEIIITAITGSIILICLVLFVVVFVVLHNRKGVKRAQDYELAMKDKELELLQAVINTQEEERVRLAQNLHDGINPLLVSQKIQLSLIQRKNVKEGREDERIKEVMSQIDTVLYDLSAITSDLAPRDLYREGLINALIGFVKKIDGARLDYSISEEIKLDLQEEVSVQIYRLVLEVFQNILKHDKPSEMLVQFNVSTDFTINIEHDGRGIDDSDFLHLSENRSGIGLRSIRTRATLVGAHIEYENSEQARIKIIIPLGNGQKHPNRNS